MPESLIWHFSCYKKNIVNINLKLQTPFSTLEMLLLPVRVHNSVSIYSPVLQNSQPMSTRLATGGSTGSTKIFIILLTAILRYLQSLLNIKLVVILEELFSAYVIMIYHYHSLNAKKVILFKKKPFPFTVVTLF